MNLKSVISLGIFLSITHRNEVYSEIISPDGGCQELLDSFARATANYTMCTIQHARPISVCEACIDSYLKVLKRYNQILKLYDEHDKQCKEELMNVDRLQVVEKGYHFVEDLWHKASCSACFKKDDQGLTISNMTDTTVKLLDLSELTDACILTNQNTSVNSSQIVCDKCKEDYLNLNSYYNCHKSAVCMDIVDMMNITRYKWSTTLGCCMDRKKIEIPFLLTTGALCLLPLLFYISLYFCSKNTEFNIVLEQTRWQTPVNS
ncbi:osteopetrosis-associated transmembrane protein 1 [Diaphorina citri]|uniref:Osteopetrosis-associated transmembrane protein 1 n=1 Tax=Diaphorina citri TaxID=121845 RepID=A0A1S3CUS6_DIACI|nr:osteopetrosis-associated transmembrane protein 1 [Diaphorina citri]KAI5731735.1 hypothetical protein M8J77_015208 [Diaphorina citri]